MFFAFVLSIRGFNTIPYYIQFRQLKNRHIPRIKLPFKLGKEKGIFTS